MQHSQEEYTRAQFWKCALQVNPFNYYSDYRNKDHGLTEDEYNEKLRQIALEYDIKILGIADHGKVDGIDNIRKSMEGSGIIVFPGFEVESSEKIHFVCLYPENTTQTTLNRYLGELSITDIDHGNAPSRLSGNELIRVVSQEQHGFIFAAHCTGSNGILSQGSFTHIWKNESLKAVQVQIVSTGGILDYEKFKSILENKNKDYKRKKVMTLLHAKDIAVPDDLKELSATSLVRMTRPSFASFVDAFFDPESRIRRNSEKIEHYVSNISNIKIVGGYLDKLEVTFSENLNTIIGGRGTGKSTLIEFIRYALSVPIIASDAKKNHDAIIKENLGKERASIILTVKSESVGGKPYTISRKYGESPVVKDEDGNISSLTPHMLLPSISIYGQNEIYEITQDNTKVAKLLDRIINYDDEDSNTDLHIIVSQLRKNREALLKIQEGIADKEDKSQQLSYLNEQLKMYDQAGINEKLSIIPLLEKEKSLIQRAREDSDNLITSFKAVYERFPESLFLEDEVINNLPQKDSFRKIREFLEAMRLLGESILSSWESQVTPIQANINNEFLKILNEITIAEKELAETFSNLVGVRGKSGQQIGNEYHKIISDIEKLKPQAALLESYKEQLVKLEKARTGLLSDRSTSISRRNAFQKVAIDKLNKNLSGKMRIVFKPESNKQGVIDFLCSCHLSNVAEGRLEWINTVDDFTHVKLAEVLRTKNPELLKEYKGVTPTVANALMELSFEKILELEELEIQPTYIIELNVSHTRETSFKKLEDLSKGQQCTAILHLLLLENDDPLIVDQPEDNLDNAFIADRIVSTLRINKLNRQFIFATHNANIPVFGDAEWIGVITATNQHGELPISHQGAIDLDEIKKLAADILEGGEEAFLQRKDKYGI